MEIELKLGLDAKAASRFLRHAAIHGVASTRQTLHSLYYDTPDFQLMKRGVALRLRRVGRQWIQTVKTRAGTVGMLSQRPEWECRVMGRQMDLTQLPDEAQRLIPAELRPRLLPVFETVFVRQAWMLPMGRSQIEVALDRGQILAGEREMPICELELELKSGHLEALFDLAERILEDIPVHLEPRSKAQRAYQLAGALTCAPIGAARLALQADAPASSAFSAIVRTCMGQFEGNLPGMLEDDDVEYLHQMRVAIRRMRAVLGLIRFMGMPVPAWSEELRWLMGELSPARDWDVLITQTIPRVQPALPEPGHLVALVAAAETLRAVALQRARAAVRSARTARLWLGIEQSLHALPDSDMAAVDWAKIALQERYRQVRRLGRKCAWEAAAERHALRIAAKKLRYAGEFFAACWQGRDAAFLDALARLQDDLGALNDLSVATHLLAEIEAAGGAATIRGCGLVTGFLARDAEVRQSDLASGWDALSAMRPYWKGRRAAKR